MYERASYPLSRSPEPGAADLASLLADCRLCCRRSGLPAELADEVLQSLALLALEGRCRIERGHHAWLRTFVGRQARRIRARRSRERPLSGEPPAPESDDRPAALRAALKQLPFRMRRALELRFLEAHPFAEVGDALQLSEGAARMLCHRALKRLRRHSPDFL